MLYVRREITLLYHHYFTDESLKSNQWRGKKIILLKDLQLKAVRITSSELTFDKWHTEEVNFLAVLLWVD